MPVTDFRQRTAVLFIAVMLGHIILISAQVNSQRRRAAARGRSRSARSPKCSAARPASPAASATRGAATSICAACARRTSELKRAARRAAGAVPAGARARPSARGSSSSCSGFKQELRVETIAASVIGAGASLDFRGITIDRGSSTGVTANMAVIAPTGVVGTRRDADRARRRRCSCSIDRNAAAGALVERSRAQGVVHRRRRGHAAHGLRAGDGRRQGRRHGRDVGHRRHLSEGVRHRQGRAGRRRQRHLQGHQRAAVGRVQPARGSAGREDAARAGARARRAREGGRHRAGHHHRAGAADVACTVSHARRRASSIWCSWRSSTSR